MIGSNGSVNGFFFFFFGACWYMWGVLVWFDGPVVVLGYIRVVVCSLYYYLVVREK